MTAATRGSVTSGQSCGAAEPSPARPVLRFAPSPNGELHLGHALSALINADFARRLGGRLLLRIEDIDRIRSRAEHIDGIFEDLRWLGLTWDEPVRRQSAHFADYAAAAKRLEAMGLLYPCFATRAEIQATAYPGAVDPDGAPIYPGLHRHLSKHEVGQRRANGELPAMRLDMSAALEVAWKCAPDGLTITVFDDDLKQVEVPSDPGRWGDVVIQRKDVPTSYHLSAVVDDALQATTHVVRGQDLLAATDMHRLLQVLLGLPAPRYHHHRLIVGPDGRKLAKSQGDTSLRQLRDQGATVREIYAWIGLSAPI